MESIYWVLCWACHRKCRHCYEDRFRPYAHTDLEAVVAEARANAPRIVASLPPRMTYLDLDDLGADGRPHQKVGRIILSGGECLLEPVRRAVTFPVIETLRARYADVGGVRIIVQTTGDILDDALVADLLARGVDMISVASTDRFHVGIDTPARQAAFVSQLTEMFLRHGMEPSETKPGTARRPQATDAPQFGFFGATEDSWIGKIWPRGRGWRNGLSTATLADNFCNRWSGGLGFLNHGYSGSEVSIEPDGSVYPCCIKTRLPIGNLLEDSLIDILDSLAGEPAYEAINAGMPQRMGIQHGWSVADFLAATETTTQQGATYRNLCIGCDAFHDAVLGPVIARARQRRQARRMES